MNSSTQKPSKFAAIENAVSVVKTSGSAPVQAGCVIAPPVQAGCVIAPLLAGCVLDGEFNLKPAKK